MQHATFCRPAWLVVFRSPHATASSVAEHRSSSQAPSTLAVRRDGSERLDAFERAA